MGLNETVKAKQVTWEEGWEGTTNEMFTFKEKTRGSGDWEGIVKMVEEHRNQDLQEHGQKSWMPGREKTEWRLKWGTRFGQ